MLLVDLWIPIKGFLFNPGQNLTNNQTTPKNDAFLSTEAHPFRPPKKNHGVLPKCSVLFTQSVHFSCEQCKKKPAVTFHYSGCFIDPYAYYNLQYNWVVFHPHINPKVPSSVV